MPRILSLLLVEDDVSLAEELGLFLSDFFEHIDFVDNAEDAYEKYVTSPYDLVITDIRLPQQNGLYLVEKIKKKTPNQLVIVISAYTEVEYFLKSIDLGIYSFLTKPFNSQQLINTMIKVTALINHQQHSPEQKNNLIVLAHDVVFDTQSKALHVKDILQELTQKEELLLILLAKNINQFVRNEEIMEYIWQDDEPTSSTLRALVKRLRDKLGYEDAITNLKSRGYKLVSKD